MHACAGSGDSLQGFRAITDIMRSYRVLLAPLRFGAGLKASSSPATEPQRCRLCISREHCQAAQAACCTRRVRAQGKIVDAWSHGLPVATTVVGAEGMSARDPPAPS